MGSVRGYRQVRRLPGLKPTVQDRRLRVAEELEQEKAPARLAETSVHRLLVNERMFFTRKTSFSKYTRKLVGQFLQTFRGGFREIGKDVMGVDRVRDMTRGIAVRIARINNNNVVILHVFPHLGGLEENLVLHVSPPVERYGRGAARDGWRSLRASGNYLVFCADIIPLRPGPVMAVGGIFTRQCSRVV